MNDGITLTVRILTFLRSLWLGIARRGRAEHALDEEIRAYVDLLAEEYERAGLGPGDARRRALVETRHLADDGQSDAQVPRAAARATAWRRAELA